MSVIDGLMVVAAPHHPIGAAHRAEALVSVAAIAQPVSAGLRAPVSWGLVFGVAQGQRCTNAFQPRERP